MIIYVDFTDDTETVICAVYSGPQEGHQYYAEIDSSDSRYADFYNSLFPAFREGLPVPG